MEVSVISTPRRKTRKRKLRARDIVERVNELTSSPLSFCESSPSSLSHDIGNVSLVADLSPSEGDCDSVVAGSVCVTSSDEESVASNSSQLSDLLKSEQIFQLPAFNSLSTIFDLCSVRMTVNDSFSQFSVDSDELVDNFSDMLSVGSDLSVRNASLLTDLFCSHFKLSDECSTVLHTLIKAFLPSPNNFPSGFSYVRNAKKMVQQEVRVLRKSQRHSFCVMSFVVQLRDTVQRNLDKNLSYAEFRKQNPYSDLNSSLSPPVEMTPQGDLCFNLLLFSDGVNIKKLTLRKELWPIWIQIADLPPRQRMSRSNIILAALFVGNVTPNWNELVPHIKSELLSSIELKHNKKSFRAFFKVKLLVSDLGAKCHMLNMFKFNGFYGCHFCTAEGKTIGKTHSSYPYGQTGQIRERDVNDCFVELAQSLPVTKLVNVAGVKGKSAFADLIEGLPITAPIDYMHCFLLGVFPEVLKLCYKALPQDEKTKVNIVISQLSCPRELMVYSRKIRSLDEVAQFKANENFNWLFYISPLVFRRRIPEKLYNHLLNLSFGVRLLLESSCDSFTFDAQLFLDTFCEEIVTIHGGNERIETINFHCLRHFVNQVRRFGPLYCYSAMSFEAANRVFWRSFFRSTLRM